MKIYADEFIQAVELIENIVGKKIYKLALELNRDSMIECRNVSIGDNIKFGKDIFVYPETHKINVSDELYARKLSTEEIGKAIAKKVEKEIIKLVEEKIVASVTPINRISDVRKFIKVVVDQDVAIELNGFNLCFRVGIREFNN